MRDEREMGRAVEKGFLLRTKYVIIQDKGQYEPHTITPNRGISTTASRIYPCYFIGVLVAFDYWLLAIDSRSKIIV